MGPHSSSDDPTRYRSDDEVAAWAKKDPIARFERFLRRAELVDDTVRARIIEELEQEITAAINEVEELGPPARETLFDDVYAERARPFERTAARAAGGAHAPRGH